LLLVVVVVVLLVMFVVVMFVVVVFVMVVSVIIKLSYSFQNPTLNILTFLFHSFFSSNTKFTKDAIVDFSKTNRFHGLKILLVVLQIQSIVSNVHLDNIKINVTKLKVYPMNAKFVQLENLVMKVMFLIVTQRRIVLLVQQDATEVPLEVLIPCVLILVSQVITAQLQGKFDLFLILIPYPSSLTLTYFFIIPPPPS